MKKVLLQKNNNLGLDIDNIGPIVPTYVLVKVIQRVIHTRSSNFIAENHVLMSGQITFRLTCEKMVSTY